MLSYIKKRGLILLIIVMAASTVLSAQVDVYASSDVPNGYTGIYTKADLNKIRNNPDGRFILMNDIVFEESDFKSNGDYYNDGSCWLPIGNDSTAFTGVFDGNNHKIINLKIRENKNKMYGFINENLGTVRDVTFKNIDANVTSGGSFGIVTVNRGTIEGVASQDGKIIFRETDAVGGIAGYNHLYGNNISTIKRCYNTSAISVTQGRYIGGIAGDNCGTIESCYNSGNITCKLSSPGGIAGRTTSFVKGEGEMGGVHGHVKNCFNTGKVSGEQAAGIAAFTNDREDNTSNIICCYNVGLIDKSGAPICNNGKVSPKNCYFLNNQKFTAKVKGNKKTLKQMGLKSTYKGFDFGSVWKMDSTSKYGLPVLKNVNANGLVVTNKKAPAVSKLKAPVLTVHAEKIKGKKYHVLKFSEVKGATGYQIYFSPSGKAGPWVKLKTLTYHPKKFAVQWNNGTKYYYKVRAYKKTGSKYTYSPFSVVKSLKFE